MKRSQIKKRPLTDTTIENLEPEDKEYLETDIKGKLYLSVKPTGAKSWKMRYKKANGKWAYHGLGAYPHVTGAMARQLLLEKQHQLALGADELSAMPMRADGKSFKTVAMDWYNTPKVQKLGIDTKTKYLGVLEKYVFPVMGNKDIADISRQAWLKLFERMQQTVNEKTGKPIIETANRTLQVCNRIYRFALTQEVAGVTSNPLDHMHERLDSHESEQLAHLSESELPKLLADFERIPSEISKIGIQLLSHLFLRPNEVLDGKWAEIDLENRLWDIPAERMKNRKPHLVPLSNQVHQLLCQLHQITGYDEYLFPSKAKTRKNAHQRFRQALKRLGYDGRQTLHGFRHIASTKLNNYTDADGKKFDERVIEFALAHKVTGVKGVYNKAEYLHDRTVINQWYSDWLDSITPSADGLNDA